MDTKIPSADSSDREGDTFEDAPDTTSRPEAHCSKSFASVRSLTGRPPSSSNTTTTQMSEPLPPMPNGNHTGDNKDVGSQPELVPQEELPKSPLLTAHRISITSLDDVHLDGNNSDKSTKSRSIETSSTNDTAQPDEPSPKLPARSQGLSGSLPSIPWGPPPPPPPSSKQTIPAPAPPSRKLTGPFSWLSRHTSGNKEAASTQQSHASALDRRNTASSINAMGSNPELMLSRLEETNESGSSSPGPRGQPQSSLRDRFKMLRMREEAGISASDAEDAGQSTASGGALAALIGRGASVGLGIGSPTSMVDEKEGGLPKSPSQSPTKVPTVNPTLPPGTVSGVSAGPSAINDPAFPVDWDLWQSVVYEGPAAVARTSPEELNRAIASGIPSAIRGVVWQVLAQSKNEELEGVYRELLVRGTDKDQDRISGFGGQGLTNGPLNGNSKEKESLASSGSSIHSDHSTPAISTTNGVVSPSFSQEKEGENIAKIQAAMLAERRTKAKEDAAALQRLEKQIKRDLGARTSYSKYAAAAGLQDGLFGVCKAYALFDEGVGYAQGMNFLVMPLLFSMPEEEAFCLLVRLMNKYHLREMFIQDMPGLHLHLYQFERLLEDLEPTLYCHLHRKAVTPQLYATQWFLTLFAYRFPLQLVLRIYDLILSEGLEGAILKFGIALMKKNAQTLLGMNDMASLTTFLKEKLFDVYIDQAPSSNSILESGFFGNAGGIDKEVYRADMLVQDACAVKISPEMLQSYTVEWELKMNAEREREEQLDSLRSNNVLLSLKVRSLEERAEKSDTEHVQMASELVRTKVVNQELQDANESLRGQVEELRSVVERQPEEVEQRLKAEMERTMTRNLEVQNENRALEEQMADMEKSLVETKMQYAEIHSDHETLKQKWNDLRKALDD
ncbi:gtpase-activating protein gyp5 [Lasallia pustulata]|uniref:GTPase-activating protein GYP5 n=1 Tax=Lasallia pustulata TaxID=136370 RepID=A0A1W5D2F2_9LECA|nr:gtpase-activating protein gyp5 [Lasallia pustulata]